MAYEGKEKWHWCMDWCKKKGIAPAQNENWRRAEKAYDKFKGKRMTKFERVLSDTEIDQIVDDFGCGGSCGNLFEIGARLEQAVLAKLEEQEPVATVQVDSVSGVDITYHRFQGLFDGMRLYAHPCVAPVSNKEACVSESEKSDTQRHLEYIKRYQKWRRGEDKTMTEAGLEPKQIGESLDWLIGFAENDIVTDEFRNVYKTMVAAAPKYTGEK